MEIYLPYSVMLLAEDTSQSCKSADTGLVCHVECLFSLRWYQIILLGEQRHMCVNNLSRVVT